MIVEKFGGSCLDSPSDVRRMVAIVKSTESLQPKIVLSAFKGVTDQLIGQARLAKNGEFDISGIEIKHREFLKELPAEVGKEPGAQVNRLLKELHDKLTAVSRLKQLPTSVLDDIAAYGEKLAIHVADGYFKEEGLDELPISDEEAGILTDGVFGNAMILDESYTLAREKLSQIHIPVVAGFFGADKAGRITTLGRGASDYVATFIAAAFGCKAVLFKDVDGVMTADPKLVPKARMIPRLNYQTAMDLARYGSKVLFEKALVPAKNAGIPLEVKSFEKMNEGTLISADGDGEAVSCMKAMSIVRISGVQSLRTGSSILGKLSEAGWSDAVVLGQTFGNEMSIVTDENHVDRVLEAVNSAEEHLETAARRGVSLVALTGKRFTQSQIFEALRKKNLEPFAILKTPSELTACVMVMSSDAGATVEALHALLEEQPIN